MHCGILSENDPRSYEATKTVAKKALKKSEMFLAGLSLNATVLVAS